MAMDVFCNDIRQADLTVETPRLTPAPSAEPLKGVGARSAKGPELRTTAAQIINR